MGDRIICGRIVRGRIVLLPISVWFIIKKKTVITILSISRLLNFGKWNQILIVITVFFVIDQPFECSFDRNYSFPCQYVSIFFLYPPCMACIHAKKKKFFLWLTLWVWLWLWLQFCLWLIVTTVFLLIDPPVECGGRWFGGAKAAGKLCEGHWPTPGRAAVGKVGQN